MLMRFTASSALGQMIVALGTTELNGLIPRMLIVLFKGSFDLHRHCGRDGTVQAILRLAWMARFVTLTSSFQSAQRSKALFALLQPS